MRRVFILNGHPGARSLSRELVEAYAEAAKLAGHEVRIRHLHDLEFDPDHGHSGYRDLKPLDPVLDNVLSDLEWAQHVVLATPMWWGGLPAKLKGLLDRIMLPGRAFDPRETVRGAPRALLGGRTARVFVTSDTPRWAMTTLYCSAMFVQLRRQVFGFVGIKPTRITHFSSASHPPEKKFLAWLAKTAELGAMAR